MQQKNVPGQSRTPPAGARTLLLVGPGTYRSSALAPIAAGSFPFSAIRAELSSRWPMDVVIAGTPVEQPELVGLARTLGHKGAIRAINGDIRSVSWDIFVVPSQTAYVYYRRSR